MSIELNSRSILTLFIVIAIACSCAEKKKKANHQVGTSGKIINVVDGDTYDLLLPNDSTIRIRMAGIDAPERGMPFYKTSKRFLSNLCYLANVDFKKIDVDKDNRVVAFTYLGDSIELGQEMVRNGMAWHFTKYSNDTTLARLELEARVRQIGLWQDDDPFPPWEVRKLHWNGISTKDSFAINPNWD